jgi:hypothetical protein
MQKPASDARERIINFIKLHGPALPYEISKQIGGDTVFASAYLSELKENGKLKISNIKVGGGSPLYYLEGQEELLEKFSDNLGQKEKQVYQLLKEKKILRESTLVPVYRAAIRTIKDFAFALNVNINGQVEVFWKWHMVSNSEAESIIKLILNPNQEKKQEEPKKSNENTIEKEIKQNLQAQPSEQKISDPIKKPESDPNMIKNLPEATQITQHLPIKADTRNDSVSKDNELKLKNELEKNIENEIPKKEIPKAETKDKENKEQKKIKLEKKKITQEKLTDDNFGKDSAESDQPKKEAQTSPFYEEIMDYFSDGKIKIIEENIVRIASEIDFIVEVPSAVGNLKYFVKAKSKKKINEGDLSAVFIQAQSKRLPVLFISKGDLTGKAKEMLDTEFKGMRFNKI